MLKRETTISMSNVLSLDDEDEDVEFTKVGVVIDGLCWKNQKNSCAGPDSPNSCGWCNLGHVYKPGDIIAPPTNAD